MRARLITVQLYGGKRESNRDTSLFSPNCPHLPVYLCAGRGGFHVSCARVAFYRKLCCSKNRVCDQLIVPMTAVV